MRISSFACEMMTIASSAPASKASSRMSCNAGLLPIGSISFGTARVSGRKRVPNPAAGMMAVIRSSSFEIADNLAVVEGMLHALHLLRRLVSFAGDDDDVALRGICQRVLDRLLPIRLDEKKVRRLKAEG